MCKRACFVLSLSFVFLSFFVFAQETETKRPLVIIEPEVLELPTSEPSTLILSASADGTIRRFAEIYKELDGFYDKLEKFGHAVSVHPY